MMPVIVGPVLCRRVRHYPSRAQLYILILTGSRCWAEFVAGLDAGAEDYLTNPFVPDELRARVHVGLRVVSLQERLSERVIELESALSKVKELHALLPICSYCKSVRSDQNYWETVEDYVAQHVNVQFTHGICPTCFDKVVGEWDVK
jgi:DNA-binding response OmpR family regulator